MHDTIIELEAEEIFAFFSHSVRTQWGECNELNTVSLQVQQRRKSPPTAAAATVSTAHSELSLSQGAFSIFRPQIAVAFICHSIPLLLCLFVLISLYGQLPRSVFVRETAYCMANHASHGRCDLIVRCLAAYSSINARLVYQNLYARTQAQNS